ncbi:MAG: ankyrin repeat domain-containing protein [Bacteroidota bacterium]
MDEQKNIYQLDITQKPALFTLIEAQNLEAVKQHLAENPAEINLKGWCDQTPLHIAAESRNYEIVDFLLEHGAQINPKEPEYLNCRSIEAIKVYLKYGIDISGSDGQNSNLLHELAWADSPEVFDFAYNNGVPWQKDSSRRTPYTLAKQGERKKITAHFLHNYKALTSNAITKLDTQNFQFEIILFLKQEPNNPQVFVALTENANLIKYKITNGLFAIDMVVNIDVSIIRNFTFDRHGDIVVPTNDSRLLIIDPQSFTLKTSIDFESGQALDQITYLPGKQKFIASAEEWAILLLDEDYTVLEKIKTDYATNHPIINEDESLIFFLVWHNIEYYNLYQFHDDLKISHLGEFLKIYYSFEELDPVTVAMYQHQFAVSYLKDLELYQFENGTYSMIWSMDTSRLTSIERKSAVAFISNDMILLGSGRTLWFIDKYGRSLVDAVDLDLKEAILKIYFDKMGQHIVITTKAEIRLFPLTIAQCYQKKE